MSVESHTRPGSLAAWISASSPHVICTSVYLVQRDDSSWRCLLTEEGAESDVGAYCNPLESFVIDADSVVL